MPNQAHSKIRVAADGSAEGDSPHPSQYLEDHVSGSNIRDMTQWAYFVIKDKSPPIDYEVSQSIDSIHQE